ncbi:MAG: hypothetical protein ACOC1K_01215 [Nanoarchaeota archaeon]
MKIKMAAFNDIMLLDYMGSAEFEFGALPKSLKVFTKNFDNLKINKFKKFKNYKNQMLVIITDEESANEYFSRFIELLKKDKLHLKEASYFNYMITGKDFSGKPIENSFQLTEAWWDIDNHVMFTFGVDNAKKIIKAIQNTREKKKNNNETEWF